MNRVGLWGAIGIGIFITVGLITMEPGYAEEQEGEPTCTLKTLKGRYLFAASGTLLPPAFGVTEPTPGADAGYHTFNGDGTGTDTVTVRVGSEIVLENFVTPHKLYGQRGLYGQLHSAQWAILRSIHRAQWRGNSQNRDRSSRQLCVEH